MLEKPLFIPELFSIPITANYSQCTKGNEQVGSVYYVAT